MRRFFRITFYFSVTVFFLVIAVLGFTQTRYFRSYLRNVILQSYSEYVDATVQFDNLEGNLVTGAQIHNVVIVKDSTEIFAAERIDVKYDLTGLLFDRVSLSSVTLVNPRIHVWRSVDGFLNVSQIVKLRPEDTTSSTTVVDIKNAEIRNAQIAFVDSLTLRARGEGTAAMPPAGGFDYAFFRLESFTLSAGARIESKNFFAQVRNLSFESRKQRFKMTRFGGDFTLSPSLVAIRNCVVETRNSIIKLEGQLKNLDVAKIKALAEFERAPVQLTVDAQKLDTRELKQFLYPSVDFLDGTFSFGAKVSGTFQTLSVDRFTLRTPRSFIKAQGRILNLHKPRNLGLELACIDNKLHPADAADFTPGLSIPSLRFLGEVRYNLVFNGKLDDFTVHLKSETDAGEIQMDGSVRVQESLAYKATVLARNIDLGIITQNDNLRSQLNAKITLDGAGTDLRAMSAVARVEIDSSSISDIPMNPSVVVIDVNDRVVRTHTTTSFGTARYDVSGRMQFHRDSTSFELNGRVGSFDLGQILKSPLYESDLTFELAAQGSWLDAARMRSDTDLRFLRSSFNKQPFDSAAVRIHYDTRDTVTQSFHLLSDVADISIDGKFGVGSFISNVVGGFEVVSKAIAYRAKHLDSLRAFLLFQLPDVPRFRAAVGVKRESINAVFKLRIHNFYPLGVFLHQKLNGSLFASGGVAGDIDDMQLNGEVVSQDFKYSTPSFVLRAKNLQAKWDLQGISRSSILETFKATMDLQSELLNMNNVTMGNLALGMEAKGSDGTYTISTLVDSTAQINLSGQLVYRGALYHLDVSELKVGLGPFLYENSDPISLALGMDGFQVKSLSMRHEAEELTASGYFNPAGVSDLDVSLKGFLLNSLHQMFKTSQLPEALRGIGGIVSGRLLLRGTFEHPNFSFDAVADGVRTGETVFGQVESRLSYFEHMLNVFVSYRYNPQDAAGAPDMLFSGSLPYELPLTAGHNHQLKGQIDLALQSKGVRLDLFSVFIPVVSNLSGFLTCDMKIRGPVEAPEYDGFLSLSSARFLFKPLNIQYILDGRFVSAKNSIIFQEVTLKNTPQDQSFGRGLMSLSGKFTLEGLKLGEFNLLANGQMLLMKEASRAPGAKLYGDLFAATGTSGVRWSGELEKSNLTGEVIVKNGRLTLPPERETIFLESRNISILFRDDTSRPAPNRQPTGENRRSSGSLLALNSPDRPVDGSLATTNGSKNEEEGKAQEGGQPKSFLDNIVYNLIIEAQGPTQLRLVFNPITNEELFADLKGRLAFEKNGPQARLSGEVEVGNRSYYNYFKRFEATGKLLFTGDALNPELNIEGKYEGVHRKTSLQSFSSDSSQTSEGKDEKVLVTLEITGTRNEPKLKFDLETEKNGKFEKTTTGDAESDAIAFLLSGQYRDELTSAKRQEFFRENLIGLTSGVLSAPLREYLRKETGVSLDVLYYGGASFQQAADVRLSGEIGDAVVRFGGRVFNNINNTNVSVELPMSSILGTESWRNLVLTLERRVEGLENFEDTRSSRGARLLYRINF